jgi:hypothetical protein
MLKKIVSALALTGLASGSAFALNNPGFEDSLGANPPGWISVPQGANSGTLTSVASNTNVKVIDDGWGFGQIYSVDVESMSGNNFGLLETCPASTPALSCTSATTFSFNLGGPVAAVGDTLWLRLFTADFDAVGYNDSVSVSYFGASAVNALAVDTMAANGLNTDSGWQGFFVPVGTQSLMVQINNVAAVPVTLQDQLYNRPIVALDYDAVTPVPEADATAMMLAGLGVLGMVARRRAKKTA